MDELVAMESELLIELDHPQAGPLKAIACPITLSQTPASKTNPAPLVGQHTATVLDDLIGEERRSALQKQGVIG